MESLGGLLARILLPYGGLALVVALIFTPLAGRVARGLDVMDRPDQRLKPHARPIPYLGGLAIWLGWTLALVALANATTVAPGGILAAIIICGAALTALGASDDVRHMPPKLRLALSACAVLALIAVTGVGDGLIRDLAVRLHVDLPTAAVRPLAMLAGVIVVLGACNSANLIDGLDGLAAGTVAIISLGFFALSAALVTAPVQAGDLTRLGLSAAMCGACLGFLMWNYNPARIFMGDAGSLLLGFNSGLLILLLGDAGAPWLLGALVIFALPVYDAALAITRRAWNRKPIFIGDRSHFYDQLRDRGFSVRQTGAVCYAVAAAFAACGLAPIWLNLRSLALLYGGLLVVTIAITFAAGLVRVDSK